MESSTITPAAEKKVTFHSEASNYRKVVKPMRRKQVGESSEIEVVGGETIEFYDGVYSTSDPDEIAFLREDASNGVYFWEVNTEADRPTDASGLIKEIIRKGREGDFDRVAAILVGERTALSRPDVLATCEAILEDAQQQLPPKPNTPLHELDRVRIGPAAGVTPGVSPDPVVGSPAVDPSTLEQPPGSPAVPTEASAVPPGQAPAAAPAASDAPSTTAEPPSATMPSAQGPQVGGELGPEDGGVTVTPPPPAEEPAPAVTGDGAPTPPPAEVGGAPGAPAAPGSEGADVPPPTGEGQGQG